MTPVVQLALTVRGNVESFNRDEFRTGLAASVGVSPHDISLEVTAASVNVVANIALSSGDDEASSMDVLRSLTALASNATALSAAVGVEVESIAPPVEATITRVVSAQCS